METRNPALIFNVSYIYRIVFALPIFAFALCIVLTLILDFERATATHCRVPNYLPSVSSAIGGFKLQKFAWQFFIALQCSPRLFVALSFHKFYPTFASAKPGFHLYALTFVDIVENLSLLFLSVVSSTEGYEYHYWGFVSFVLCSQLHMILKIMMISKIKHDPQFSKTHQESFHLKKKLWLANFSFLLLSVYFFYRHNAYCEPGVYTLFALCEYIIVVSNIAFHGTAFYEFEKSALIVDVGNYYEEKNKPF